MTVELPRYSATRTGTTYHLQSPFEVPCRPPSTLPRRCSRSRADAASPMGCRWSGQHRFRLAARKPSRSSPAPPPVAAAATRRNDAAEWHRFPIWCTAEGHVALPAHLLTDAPYLLDAVATMTERGSTPTSQARWPTGTRHRLPPPPRRDLAPGADELVTATLSGSAAMAEHIDTLTDEEAHATATEWLHGCQSHVDARNPSPEHSGCCPGTTSAVVARTTSCVGDRRSYGAGASGLLTRAWRSSSR